MVETVGSAEHRAETTGFVFIEEVTPELATHARLETMEFQAKSPFQDVKVIRTTPFGKTLILDDKTQSSQVDEHIYHECLVQPALILHPNPKTVFIGGGGEYATAREILKHESVEKVIMVDIDQLVCEISLEKLPEWSDGAHEDPRLEVHYTDAKKYLEDYEGCFDVIIMDIADPIEAGPGIALYFQEFYQTAKTKLNRNGILVTQSGGAGLLTYNECFCVINNTLRSVFDHVHPYSVEIPSYGSPWGFNIAYDSGDYLLEQKQELPNWFGKAIDDRCGSRLIEGKTLKFYDSISHRGVFGCPRWLRDGCKNETRIMTKETPVFMY